MTKPEVLVVKTGVANIASVLACLARLDTSPRLCDDPTEIENANYVVLPGVGTFHASMLRLEELDLVEPLKKRISRNLPTLCICVGLQLLCACSEESPGAKGLEIVAGNIERFPKGLKIPQLGWNRVHASPSSQYLTDGYAYFANSFCLKEAPTSWTASTANYGGNFVAAMEHGRVLACQFHPELSGDWGQNVVSQWLQNGEK